MSLSKKMKGLTPCFAGRWVRLVFTLMCLMYVPGLWAQGTADIVGTVTDNSGSVVPNAKVTAKNLGTNLTRTQQTDASGQYAFTLLPVGDYSVSIEVMGFKAFSNPRLAWPPAIAPA